MRGRIWSEEGGGDDDEFVAGVADDMVVGTEGGLEGSRESFEAFVADLVAVGVVDDHEGVEVEEEDGRRS